MAVIEIVPWEAGGAAGAKVGQNEAGVTWGAEEGSSALAGSTGGVTFCRDTKRAHETIVLSKVVAQELFIKSQCWGGCGKEGFNVGKKGTSVILSKIRINFLKSPNAESISWSDLLSQCAPSAPLPTPPLPALPLPFPTLPSPPLSLSFPHKVFSAITRKRSSTGATSSCVQNLLLQASFSA